MCYCKTFSPRIPPGRGSPTRTPPRGPCPSPLPGRPRRSSATPHNGTWETGGRSSRPHTVPRYLAYPRPAYNTMTTCIPLIAEYSHGYSVVKMNTRYDVVHRGGLGSNGVSHLPLLELFRAPRLAAAASASLGLVLWHRCVLACDYFCLSLSFSLFSEPVSGSERVSFLTRFRRRIICAGARLAWRALCCSIKKNTQNPFFRRRARRVA